MRFEGDMRVLSNLNTPGARVGLVVLGTMQAGAAGCGFISALHHQRCIERFVAMGGNSCGAAAIAYAVSGQAPLAGSIHYEEALEAIRVTRGVSFDIARLMLSAKEGKKRMNMDTFKASPVECFVALTDYDTGQGMLLDAKKAWSDPFGLFQASMSVPFLCPPVYCLGSRYCDGAIGLPVPAEQLQKRFNLTDLLIIANQEPGSWVPAWFDVALCATTVPLRLKQAVLTRQSRRHAAFVRLREQQHFRVGIVWGDAGIGSCEQDPKKLQMAEQQGFEFGMQLVTNAGN